MSLDLIATIYGETPQGGTTEAPVALTGVDSVQVCGKNMLPNKAKTNTVAGITYTVNPDKSVTAKGTTTSWGNIVIDADFSLPAGTYTLNSNMQAAGVNLVIGKDTSGTKHIAVSATTSKTFELSAPIKHCVAYIAVAPDSVVDTTIYPMLNLGNTAMPYEPYQGSVTPLPIPRPLHKVGDVRDVCRTRVKSVYDKRIVLDGTESWKVSSVTSGMFFIEREINPGTAAICSNFVFSKSATTEQGKFYIVNNQIRFLTSYETLENWKAFLTAQKEAGTPVTVYYQSTAYDGTNGLDVCLTEYLTGFAELAGTETWTENTDAYWKADGYHVYMLSGVSGVTTETNLVCSTHSVKKPSSTLKGSVGVATGTGAILFSVTEQTTLSAWKAYLAAQKAAGTPVQIAYQLATPEVYATDPVDIFVETIFPIVVSDGPITYKVVAHMHPFKTDWKVQPKTVEGYYNGDWFEIEDYNSILDNYQTIYKIAKALYPNLQIPTFVSPTLGAPTKASEINTIERTIDAFKTLTIALSDVGATKTWLDNDNLFNFEDINRWEQVALSYYTVFLGQVELLPKLQFKLGGAQF